MLNISPFEPPPAPPEELGGLYTVTTAVPGLAMKFPGTVT